MTRIELIQPMTGENYGGIVDGVPENDRVASTLDVLELDPSDTERIFAELSGPGLLAVEVDVVDPTDKEVS